MEIKVIQKRIFELRGMRGMLDMHLAELYEVETRALKQAVRRKIDRFPEDFMFELNKNEWEELITKRDNLFSGSKFSPSLPFAFSEQGVAMLSGALKSKKAVQVNISIIRAFALLRQFAMDYKDIKEKIERLEKEHNAKFEDIFKALNYLLSPKSERTRIGFKIQKDKDR